MVRGSWSWRVFGSLHAILSGVLSFSEMRGSSMVARLRRHRSGQAMVEFLVVAGMVLASLAILTIFLATFREYGTRVLDLVGSEYP